jgi:hypothetical protein
MEANASDGDEAPFWRVPSFSFFREPSVQDGGNDRRHYDARRNRMRLQQSNGRRLRAGPRIGQYNDPKRVVAFNTAEKWSSDVSEDVAWEVLKRTSSQGLALPASTRSFCEFHVGLRETALAERALI